MAFGDTISETVLGKPTTPEDTNPAPNTIAEGAAVNTSVGITAHSTFANGSASLDYSLSADSSGGGFKIDQNTGVVTVADPSKIDFESAPGHVYTITVLATKNNNFSSEQTFTISVTDVAPSTPVDSNAAANTVLEGAANGTTVGITASSTDVNGGALTYSLTGDTSGGGFTINATTGVVTVADGTKIDFESAPGHAYTVTVQSSDGTLTSSQSFTINVGDVAMSTPVDSNGAANTVAEGAANGSTVGITASAGDPNGPATTYSLTNDAGGRFTINSSTGVVTVANGAAIDFETAPGHAYGITVQATSGAQTTSQAFSIGVTDVAPSTPTDSNGTGNSVFEGAANGTAVGITAASTDPGGGPAPTFALTDNAGGRFAINATTGVVTVANGAAIDFETAPGPGHSYGITVQSTAGALSSTQNFSIAVGDVNEAPAGTDKTVTMLEGDSYAFTVADFGFSDPSDSVNPNSLLAVKMTTVPGAGTGTFTNNGITVNAGDFVSATDIAAGHLVFAPTAHSNGSPEATFTFQVQDNGGTANGGVDLDQSPNTVTINVNAVNDAPVNSVPVAAQNLNEEGSLVFSSGNGNAITISDIDVGSGNETVTLTVTGGTLSLGSTAGLISFTNNASSINLTGTVANVNAALNGLTYTGNFNFNGTDTLVVSTNDNGNTGAGGPKTDTDNVTINVAPVNDAPVNNVPGSQTVNEDTNLVFTGPNAISISDVDAGAGNETVTLSVASGALTLNGTAGLAFTVGDGTADSTMTFSGTVAAINTALNGLIYKGNLNFNGSDTLSITTNDNGNTGSGGALSDTDSFTINVTAVNDAPVVMAGHTLNYTENQAATAIDPAITVSDVDSANLASATVQITGNYVNGEDVLAFSNTATITGTFDALTGKLTLTGSDTVANYQAALASITYVNTSDNPSGAARTVTIITNDGTDNSIAATDTINVTPVNDAPVVTAGHTLNYTENQAAIAIDPAIAVSDVDSANLASATVQITGNYVNGEDVLGFSNTATITGTFDALTGKLTLTGSDTVANYQAALASVTYVNTSDNPSGLARTVTIITNDGALNSVAATDTINVTPVNDAPVATAGHTLNYTENQAATAIDPAFTVSDVDSANLASATVQITGNYVNGQDVLSFSNTATITGSFDALTGKLTLTGSDTVASYQAAIDSVKYSNTSDDPSAASRTVTIITNDGAADSVAVTDTITVQPVNDAPTLTATGNNPNYSNGVDLFSAVSASTVEAGQSLDQLKLTVTNISGTAADSLTIDGTSVALTDGNVVSTSTPGVTATVAVSGSTATVTIDSTPGLSNAAMSALIDGLSYTDTNVNPGDPARVVTITQLHDTGGTTPGVDTATLNITSTVFFDQPPVVTAGHTLNYTENQAATAFDPAITVTDADNANLASATVQITGNYVNGEDVLAFSNTATITGTFDALTGKLTLTGSDTVAHYQAALASITYVNTSDNPSGAPRTVTITANDGLVDSTPVTDTINVTPVNDAPVVTAGHTLNYTENQAATPIDPAITVSDVDSANLASATVQITGNYVNGEDVLAFSNTATITGSFDALTGKLTLTGSDTVANYQAALASVTYANTSENPSGLARTVTFIANDGVANSVAQTDTINVTPVNDAPVTTAGGTLSYTENQAATVIDASVTVTDVDNANMASATVAIGTGFATGQDVLDANVTGTTIGKSYNAATGVLTLTGSDTKAHYQQVLDSVSYFNSSDNPSGADRTINYTVNDGALNSNTSTATVHVTPVNDAPVVTATGTLAYTENNGALAIAPALTVTDADTATLTTASVVISANYVNGEDVLGFTNTPNITGTFNAATGTMTLTGTDTVANYQAALRSVTYTDTSENPSTSARTVTFTADDGQGLNHLSAGSNHTITVASVDDAPTVTVPGAQDGVSAHTDTAITGISTNDVDAGALAVKVSLATTHGNITLDLSGGATLADATANGSHSVHITGTLTQVNSALSSLIYHGDAGFTGADALTVQTDDLGHTGTGGPLSSSVGTVNIGVIPKVWFIDNTASAVGEDGSQAHPFHSIAAFNAINDGGANHAQTGDYIYLKTGTGIYSETDGIHLLNGQQLVGGGDGLTFTDPLNNANTLTIETAGTRPVIDVTGGAGNDAIHLAQDNTIHGFNIATENAAATGIADNGGTVGTLSISNMDVGVDPDGAGALAGNLGQAISITHGGTGGSMTFGTVNSGGGASGIALGGALVTSFTATGGTLSGHTGTEFSSNGGSGNVSYGGAIGDGSGNTSVSITGRSGGTVTLSGNITDGSDTGGGFGISGNANTTVNFTGTAKTLDTGIGDGVSITNNTGTSSVNFTNGGLTVHTTNGTAFQDTVAGSVSVTGSGNTLTTVTSNGTGTALNLDHVTVGAGGVTFDNVTTTANATPANSSANGILLNTLSGGAITVGDGSIAGATSRGVDINTTANTISIGADISTSSTGRSVEVTGTTGNNTIAFSGAIDDNGLGVNLTTNTGTTMNFTGGVQIDAAGANNGFVATGGGTVQVTGTGNHIATAGGTALNISNTTIGSSNVTFHDINANGGTNGIVLNTTGASGHLAVTGSGSAAIGGDNSGGIIQNVTNYGISLANTLSPSFTNMSIHDIGRNGIDGTGVTNFTFDNGQITNTGTSAAGQFEENGIAFVDRNAGPTANTVSGNVAITDSLISGANLNGIMLETWNGTISNLNISNNTMTGATNVSAAHNAVLATTANVQDAIHVFAQGSASTTANITTGTINNNTISGFEFFNGTINVGGNGIRVVGGSGNAANNTVATLGTAANPIEIGGNDVDNVGSNAIATSFNGQQGISNFNIHNNGTVANPMSNAEGLGISVFFGGSGTFSALVNNNAINNNGPTVNAGSAGIAVQADDGPDGLGNATGVSTIHVNNNTVTNPDGFGIRGIVRASHDTLNLYVQNNDVGTPSATNREAIRIDSGSSIGDTTLNLNMSGNSGPLASTTDNLVGSGIDAGIGLRKQGTVLGVNEFNLQGIAANPTNAQVQAYVGNGGPTGNHSADGSGGSVNGVDIISGSNYGTTNAVPLLAASGGVQASSPTPGESHLTQAQLDSVVAAAIAQWATAGASASQLAALAAITFSVETLTGDTVSEQTPGHIVIDADAAGHGWFVDPTPNDNSEFTHAANAAGTDLYTDPTNAAAGHLDLLTAVTHEMGHELGLPDDTAASDVHDLMYIDLVDGERRIPDAADVAQAKAATSVQAAEAAVPASAQAVAGTPTVTGTAGNDTIDAGHGGNILFGGAGADTFVFGPATPLNAPTPAQVTHVADYSAAQGDSFDFSAITSAFHNSSVNDSLVVRAVEDASGKFATLQVDHIDPMGLPSAPNWVNVAQLDGAHAGDSVNVLIDNHSVHLAQIHVGLLV